MADALNQAIVVWASGQVGKTVDRGECWDLANRALLKAHAKSSNDLGPSGKDANYVWGEPVAVKDVEAGDILQMRDFDVKVTTKTTTTFSDGTVMTGGGWTREERPHHTAIVERSFGNGKVVILEQNYQHIKRVFRHEVFVSSPPDTVTTTATIVENPVTKRLETAQVIVVTSVKVSGQLWAYRPKGAQ